MPQWVEPLRHTVVVVIVCVCVYVCMSLAHISMQWLEIKATVT